MSDYKKVSMTHQQRSLGGVLPSFMRQFGWWDFVCALSPIHNIQGENGVYQRWTIYALKSKSMSEMNFPTIWRSYLLT